MLQSAHTSIRSDFTLWADCLEKKREPLSQPLSAWSGYPRNPPLAANRRHLVRIAVVEGRIFAAYLQR